MAGTSLAAGDVAVIGYSTSMHDGTGHPDLPDSISIVLLHDIAAGTSFFLTDRTWNGSAFSVTGTDGTYTYTAATALSAGTVITISQAQLSAAGVDFDFVLGEAVYIYQGTNANTPTSFLTALEAGDGNSTFNSSLANTGLSAAAGTAAAIPYDVAAYAGPTTYAASFMYNGAGVTLQKSIADATNWTGSDQSGVNAVEQRVQTGPWLVAPDMDMWGATAGGGGGLMNVSEDHTVASGGTSYDTSILYNGLLNGGVSVFFHMSDLEFDTVDGKFFLVDSDITGGHNRILEGNISDLLSNPGTAPTLITLYSDPGTTTAARLDNLTVDVANNIVYFTHGSELMKVNYDTPSQTPTTLFEANVASVNPAGSTNNFFNDMVIDFAHGEVYLSSTRVLAGASGDAVSKNFIYQLTGLTAAAGTNFFTMNGAANSGNARLLPFVDNDISYNPFPGTNTATSPFSTAADPYAWAIERGTLDGLAIDPVNRILYFSTGEILYDQDGNSGTAPMYAGGVVASYALTSNAAGNATILFQQPGQEVGAVPGIMGDLEIDTVTGRYYVTDYNGTSASNTDQNIWTGSLSTPGTPTQFTSDVFNVNGLSTVGMTINHAPTLTGTALAPSVTEASNAPSSGETTRVAVFSNLTIDDVDTTTVNEISGAVVRISGNFQSGATHQDFLRIGGATSGSIGGTSISFTYDATTGAMVLTGPGSVAQYKAALELVTFSTSGDDPTAYGNAGTRQIAVSVSDGLSMSDETSATVTVTGINDAPVNTPGAAANINEDSSANAIAGISIADVDANPATQKLVVTLSVAHGTISLATNVAGGIVVGDITGGANGSATITVTATQNAINATLAAGGLTYTPTANFNGADSLTIVTNDQGFNGTDPGLTGTASSEQDSDPKTINIANVNDAPVVVSGTTQATTTIAEDTPLAAGQSISSLLGAHFDDSIDQQQVAVTNPTGSVANTLAGIAVTANGSSGSTGQWQFSTDGGTTWTNIGAASVASARLYNAGTLLRFNPALNYNGAEPTLTVHLVDSSGAAITDNANPNLTGLFGGTNRYSSGTVDLGGTVTAVDDAPVNTPGATATLAEDASNVALTGISINDVDVGSGNLTVTLSVQHGTLTIATNVASGITAAQVTGGAPAATGATSITVTATQAQINATLAAANGLTYTPTANYNGSDALHIVTSDNGNTGSGGPLTDTDDKTITITAVNDPVTTTAPASASFAEDTPTAITGLSIADVDATLAPSGLYSVTLTATHGTMTLTTLTGLTFTAGDGTADASMTFNGTLAAINTALATLGYSPDANYSGSATISFSATDQVGALIATGSGSATSDSDVIALTVTAVNDAPVNTVPGAQSLAEDATLTFTGGNAISVADADLGAGNLTVTLSVAHGTLSLSGIAGLSFGTGDGTDDATMTFSGTASAINTALNGLVYKPAADYNGPDTLSIVTNDNGNTGSPGALQDSDSVGITVTSVNDPPSGADNSESTAAAVTLVFTAADFTTGYTDVENNAFQAVKITTLPAIGTIKLNGTAITAGDLISLADLNAGHLTYDPGAGVAGDHPTFTFQVQDDGGTANGGVDLDQSPNTFTINIVVPDNAPVVDLDSNDSSGATGGDFASAYTEGGAGAAIADTDATITDADAGDQVTGATISISDPETGDQLNVSGALPAGISASGAGTGTITLTGTASQADYQTALAQILYSSSSDDPTLAGTHATRDIGVTVTDGHLNSAPRNTTVTITGVNDAPSNSLGGTIGTGEDAIQAWLSGMSVADVDAGNHDIQVVFHVGHGTLDILTNVGGGIVAGNVTGNGTATVTVTGSQSAIDATLAAVNGLTYTPTTNYNGADTLTVTTDDLGNTGTGGSLQTISTRTISISDVNDAPVVAGDGTESMTPINEDVPSATGQTFSSLLGGQYSDAADAQFVSGTNPTGSSPGAFSGVAVTANGSSGGTGQWQYSNDGGTTWHDIGAASAGAALLFNAGTALRFNPAANYFGAAPTLSVHLIDNSLGFSITDGQTVDLSGVGATGGTTAYSTGTVVISQDINAVNDPPAFDLNSLTVGFNTSISVNENDPATTIAPNATVSDVDSADFNGGTMVIDVGNPDPGDFLNIPDQGSGANKISYDGSGNLTYNGQVIGHWNYGSGPQTIEVFFTTAAATPAAVQALVRDVTYFVNTDTPAAGTRSVLFSINDGDGGHTDRTANIAVTPQDDPTVANGDTGTTDEAHSATIAVLANDTDPDGPKAGIAKIDGQAVSAGQTITLSGSGAKVTLNNDGTLTYDPNGKFNHLTSPSGGEAGAVNTSALDSFTYVNADGSTATVNVTVNGVASADDWLMGDSGNNAITGTANGDLFMLQQGGNDAATGLGGNDVFYFGAAMTSADSADGGSGRDAVVLQGDYSGGLTLGAGALVNMEALSLQSGSVTKYGDTANNLYSYDITTVDANVAAGQQMIVNAALLLPGENFTFNGSAETDGKFLIYGGGGTDHLTGGAGNDIFYFEGDRWNATDTVDGGGGRDGVVVTGSINGLNHIVVGVGQLHNVEALSVSQVYASNPAVSPSYDIVLNDGNVTPGGSLIVNANTLTTPSQTFSLDAHTVTGNLIIFSGAGADTIVAGSGNDLIYGCLGQDVMTGGGGVDTFQFRNIAESTTAAPDHILDFVSGTDKIDLAFIDADPSTPGDDPFVFSNDGSFHGIKGEVREVFDSANHWWVVDADVNGDGVADFTIHVTTAGNAPLVSTDFIL